MSSEEAKKSFGNGLSDSTDSNELIDPIEGLRQLEKLISEAKEFDSKHKSSFNGNKMLNDLLDKPIAANTDANDDDLEDDIDEEDLEEGIDDGDGVGDGDGVDEEAVDEDFDDISDDKVDDNCLETKGQKRAIEDDEEVDEEFDEEEPNEELNEEPNDEPNEETTEDQNINKTEKKSKTTKSSNEKNRQKKKKKSSNPSLRKNIKTIFNEKDLDKETQLARKEEEERIVRQRERSAQRIQELQQMQNQFNNGFPFGQQNDFPFSQSFGETPDEVLLSSDDEEDKQSSDLRQKLFNDNKSHFAEVIDLSSSDDESTPTDHMNDYYGYGCSSGATNMDYNMISGIDNEVSIISSNSETVGTENNFEDVNNCGSHTDDLLNTFDAEGRVLVNVAHPQDDPDIYLAPQIAQRVKPHQIGGIRFLYDNLIESLDIFKKSSGFGCILSHSMGLGKTMQVIAFIDVFLSQTDAKYVLCIVPINTLQNWIAEFNMWLPAPEDGTIDKFFSTKNNKKVETNGEIKYRNFRVFAINEAKSTTTRAKEILSWRKFGGVLLLGYEMYRILTSDNKSKSKKDEDIDPKILDEITSKVKASLIDPGPDLVVCDEGHRIKNCNAATSQALKNIKTKRRIVLTGYPLQNKLLEYWCMVDFVRPNYLGLKAEFINMFERPITNGQCIDSTANDRKIMKYRAHVLYQLLKGFVQRRSHSVLKKALPVKCEYVLMCRMTQTQKDLMMAFLDIAINDPDAIGTSKGRISTLTLFAVCCKVWNHPDIVYDIVRKGIVSDDLDIEIPTKNSRNLPKNNRKKKPINEMTSNSEFGNESKPNPFNSLFSTPLRQKNEGVLDFSWADEKLRHYSPGILDNSYKMVLLFEIIAESIALGDRLLVFSQSLLTLDLIERFLQSRDVPKTTTKWSKNQTYYRLDGSTSTHEREKYINLFNNTNTAHLFLISTRAGSLGINLIGANRIVIFDASWNPCHDAQAACRIYRYGQPKPCFIYRLVCDNSLEKKIYDRQVNKQGMANRVVDEQNVEANFTWREIHSLLDDLHEIKEPPIEVYSEQQLSKFSDELVKRICSQYNHCLTRIPFEHESLLLDRKEQKLSSLEKKIAFGNYNEAKRLKSGLSFDVSNPYASALRSPMTSRNFGNKPYNPPFIMPYNMSAPSSLPSQMTPNPNYYFGNMSSYPDVSQPLPPYSQPRGQSSTNFANFESIAETLVRSGHSVKKVRIPNDLNISVCPNMTVSIKKGEEVMVIRTQKGLYLRTNDGNIISIKNTNNAFGSALPPFIPISNNDSFGIIQPNLQCGGTVHCVTPSHSRASSTVSHPPEVVQLSDDDSSDTADNISSTFNKTQTLSTGSEPSVVTNGSFVHNSNTSLMPSEPEDNETLNSFIHSNSQSFEINSVNQSNEYLLNTQIDSSFESLLGSSVVNSSAFDSLPDPTSPFFTTASTTPSSQLNGSSVNLETLEI